MLFAYDGYLSAIASILDGLLDFPTVRSLDPVAAAECADYKIAGSLCDAFLASTACRTRKFLAGTSGPCSELASQDEDSAAKDYLRGWRIERQGRGGVLNANDARITSNQLR